MEKFVVITRGMDDDTDVMILKVKNYDGKFGESISEAQDRWTEDNERENGWDYDYVGDAVKDVLTKNGYEFEVIAYRFAQFDV